MAQIKDSISKTDDLINDTDYLKESNYLIKDSLSKGLDVIEFADGTIMTTHVKVTEIKYIWDAEKKRMTKISSRRDFI